MFQRAVNDKEALERTLENIRSLKKDINESQDVISENISSVFQPAPNDSEKIKVLTDAIERLKEGGEAEDQLTDLQQKNVYKTIKKKLDPLDKAPTVTTIESLIRGTEIDDEPSLRNFILSQIDFRTAKATMDKVAKMLHEGISADAILSELDPFGIRLKKAAAAAPIPVVVPPPGPPGIAAPVGLVAPPAPVPAIGPAAPPVPAAPATPALPPQPQFSKKQAVSILSAMKPKRGVRADLPDISTDGLTATIGQSTIDLAAFRKGALVIDGQPLPDATVGLARLILLDAPDPGSFTQDDVDNYAAFLSIAGVKLSKGTKKYKESLTSIYPDPSQAGFGIKGRRYKKKEDEEESDSEDEGPMHELEVLIGSIDAGNVPNKKIKHRMMSLLDILVEKKEMKPKERKKMIEAYIF